MSKLYSVGKKYITSKQYEQAILNLKAVLDDIKSDNKLYVLTDLGYAYLSIHDYDNAIYYLDEALKINNNFIYANYNKACALHRLKMYDEEISLLNNVIQNDANYSNAYYQMAISLYRKGLVNKICPKLSVKIIDLCDKFISFNNEVHKGYNLKGQILYELGNLQEGKDVYIKSIETSPKKKHLMYTINKLKETTKLLDFNFQINKVFNYNIYISLLHSKEYNINEDLRKLLFDMKERYKNDPVSNSGGWQSPKYISFLDHNIHRDKSLMNSLNTFHLYILVNVFQYVKSVLRPKNNNYYFTLDGDWINISKKTNFNNIHNHGINTISGCYYIDSGYTDKTKNTSLLFHNNENKLSNNHSLLGIEGTLALWDSNIYHSVPPHKGDKERISYAFNVNIVYN